MPDVGDLPAPPLESPRVLLLDDSSDDRLLVRRELERAFADPVIVEVDSREGFEEVVSGEPFEVAVSDYHLGWGDGLSLLHRLRDAWPHLATVMFTGTGTEKVAAQALRDGVDDYVLKAPDEYRRLPLAVYRALERHRHRAAVARAEQETRDLLERLPAGIYRSTLGGALLYGNPAFLELFGVADAKALLGADLAEAYTRPEARAAWIRTLEAEGVAEGEFETLRPGGGVRWIRNRSRLVRAPDGRPLFIEGVIEDITERKAVEAELEHRGRKLALLQGVTSVANEMEDFDAALAAAMRKICDSIGWPVAHAYTVGEDGRTFEPTPIWVRRDSEAREAFERETAATSFCSGEGLIGRVRRTGRPEWIEDLREGDRFVRAQAAIDSGLVAAIGVPVLAGIRTVAVVELLHTSPQPEDAGLSEALYQAGVQLGRVAEREGSAQERRRIEAKARRAQKMEAVGRLAGGIAHDFNNLITILLMESRTAQAVAGAPEEVRQALKSIFETSERAALLTRQLLSFSKGRPGEAMVVSIREAVAELTPMLQRIIGERHKLETRLTDAACHVRIDRVQLDQVVMNLVVNARDAMSEGGTITVAASRREVPIDPTIDVDTDCVVLTVTDEGHGIPADLQDSVFEPFFSTKAEHGTGLGLSICYGAVTSAGGDLRLYSEEGVGTTFSIVLPSVDVDVGEPSAKPEPLPIPTGSETILVVEDDEEVRRVTARALEAQGYATLETRDAEEALSLLADGEGRPRMDLIVCDVVLPGMGGPDLLDVVRRLDLDLPVVLISGYGEDLVRRQVGPDVPQTVVLQKPFSVVELAREVRRLLDEP